MEKVLLDIPFYQNKGDGNACFQVAMRSVISYFLKKEMSLEELDKATGRRPGFLTNTLQIVPVLHRTGLGVQYYSREGLDLWLKDEEEIKQFYRAKYEKDADYILSHVDIKNRIDAAKEVIRYGLFEIKDSGISDIERRIKEGSVPMVLLNWNVINSREGYYGHFVVVTGYDRENLYLHNSGPAGAQANMKISKEAFEKAWESKGTDKDIVVVSGIRIG